MNEHKLVRGLGLVSAISIVVGSVIGTGVFLKARIMTCNAGSPLLVLGVWVAAAGLSLAGALTYSELAAMMPAAGGEYVFIREAFGRRLSFIYGWTQTLICYSGSQAAKAAGFAIFLNIFSGGAFQSVLFRTNIAGHNFTFGTLQIVALAIMFLTTFVNCASVSVGGKVASFLTALKILLLAAIGIGAFFLAQGSWANLTLANAGGTCEGVSAAARGGISGIAAAMLGALWAYDGWSNLTVVAGEVKNPQRNIPIALIFGMFVVVALYLFINTAYFYTLTPTQIASVPANSSVAAEVVRSFLGPAAVSMIAMALVISSLGSLQTGLLAAARIPYAMAQDGLFFSALGRVSSGSRVPVNALLAQSVWIAMLILSGSFDTLTDYAMFAAWIFYVLNTIAVFIFRRTMPNAERPYRVWGYPVVPIIFLIVATWLLVNTVWTAPLRSLIGLGLIALGLPFYQLWARKLVPQ